MKRSAVVIFGLLMVLSACGQSNSPVPNGPTNTPASNSDRQILIESKEVSLTLTPVSYTTENGTTISIAEARKQGLVSSQITAQSDARTYPCYGRATVSIQKSVFSGQIFGHVGVECTGSIYFDTIGFNYINANSPKGTLAQKRVAQFINGNQGAEVVSQGMPSESGYYKVAGEINANFRYNNVDYVATGLTNGTSIYN